VDKRWNERPVKMLLSVDVVSVMKITNAFSF